MVFHPHWSNHCSTWPLIHPEDPKALDPISPQNSDPVVASQVGSENKHPGWNTPPSLLTWLWKTNLLKMYFPLNNVFFPKVMLVNSGGAISIVEPMDPHSFPPSSLPASVLLAATTLSRGTWVGSVLKPKLTSGNSWFDYRDEVFPWAMRGWDGCSAYFLFIGRFSERILDQWDIPSCNQRSTLWTISTVTWYKQCKEIESMVIWPHASIK